jgi:hypothetical protein
MIERAPSGAYEEDWRLQSGSRSFAAHLTKRDATTTTCLYVAGEHAIYARNRAVDLPSDKTLLELARDAKYDCSRLQELVDCEFLTAAGGNKVLTSRLSFRRSPGERVSHLASLGSKL